MEVAERKIENQVQFWALLGPFLVLLSIAILLFKVSDHWYIPLSALIGIPLCVKWQMKGMAGSLALLSMLLLSTYQDLELGERYWHIGLSLAMAFSFIILTLSLEEAQGLLQKLQLQSDSRLDNFSKLDQKWKEAEQGWEQEKETFLNSIRALTADMVKVQEEKQTFYKLAQLAKDELVLIRTHHGELLQDLTYKKQQIAQLNERVEETELTIQGFLNTDSEQQIEHLTNLLTSAEDEKEALENKKTALETKITQLEADWQSSEKEKTCLAHELQHSQEREQALISMQEEKIMSLDQLRSSFNELEDSYLLLSEEKMAIAHEEKELREQLEQCTEELNALSKENKHLHVTLRSRELQLTQQVEQQQTQKSEFEKLLAIQNEQKVALQKDYEQQMMQRDNQQQLALQIDLQQAMKIDDVQNIIALSTDQASNSFKAKYLQLREQFQEKSNVLNATRRELFYLQEKLLRCEKEAEEDKLSGPSQAEAALLRDLLKLNSQFEMMKKLYQAEIDELTYTISCLFKQL